MRITKVYTRKGDDGTTGLVGNSRVSKNCPRIHAYGTVDELNACLGMARSMLEVESSAIADDSRNRILKELTDLQNLMFTLGADLATRLEDRWDGMPIVTQDLVSDLEHRLDHFNAELPPLTDFVLPHGTPAVSALHVARTVCRRAERDALALRDEEPIGEAVIPFLNRTSDFLFVLSRWLCLASGRSETTWTR